MKIKHEWLNVLGRGVRLRGEALDAEKDEALPARWLELVRQLEEKRERSKPDCGTSAKTKVTPGSDGADV